MSAFVSNALGWIALVVCLMVCLGMDSVPRENVGLLQLFALLMIAAILGLKESKP